MHGTVLLVGKLENHGMKSPIDARWTEPQERHGFSANVLSAAGTIERRSRAPGFPHS
jgi:hypothetical protein